MKKKIKELTLEEARVICNKNISCSNCPLNFNKKATTIPCYLDKLKCDEYTTYYQLNKEVEVDESNND